MDINFLLFEQFETLDLFGPVEICGRHPDFQLHYISQNGGLVTSTQGVRIDTEPQRNMNTSGVLVIPGGAGTRTLIKEEPFLKNYAVFRKTPLSSCPSVPVPPFLPDAGSSKRKGLPPIKELSTGSFPHPIKSIG